jgi:hypothetical protein
MMRIAGSTNGWLPQALTVTLLGVAVSALLALPVMAEISRLTTLPLGKGVATITWTGKRGDNPSINSIHGSARGFAVVASKKSPKFPGDGSVTSGSTSTPKSVPIADITGTIDRTHFAFNVSVGLSGGASSGTPGAIGSVAGTFHGQHIDVVLSAKGNSEYTYFEGTIGGDKIGGTIDPIRQHGRTSTVHAIFDVTR